MRIVLLILACAVTLTGCTTVCNIVRVPLVCPTAAPTVIPPPVPTS